MRRATRDDIQFINGVFNDPEVRPHVYDGEELIDVTDGFDVLLFYVSDHGVILLEALGHGDFLATAGFVKGGRGVHSVNSSKSVMDDLFANDCTMKIGMTVKDDNAKSLRFCKSIGFRVKAKIGGRVYHEMDYIEWALSSKACLEEGEKGKADLGLDLAEEHTRLFGAFLLTVKGGWPGKALMLINKFLHSNAQDVIIQLDSNCTMFTYCGKSFKVDNVK